MESDVKAESEDFTSSKTAENQVNVQHGITGNKQEAVNGIPERNVELTESIQTSAFTKSESEDSSKSSKLAENQVQHGVTDSKQEVANRTPEPNVELIKSIQTSEFTKSESEDCKSPKLAGNQVQHETTDNKQEGLNKKPEPNVELTEDSDATVVNKSESEDCTSTKLAENQVTVQHGISDSKPEVITKKPEPNIALTENITTSVVNKSESEDCKSPKLAENQVKYEIGDSKPEVLNKKPGPNIELTENISTSVVNKSQSEDYKSPKVAENHVTVQHEITDSKPEVLKKKPEPNVELNENSQTLQLNKVESVNEIHPKEIVGNNNEMSVKQELVSGELARVEAQTLPDKNERPYESDDQTKVLTPNGDNLKIDEVPLLEQGKTSTNDPNTLKSTDRLNDNSGTGNCDTDRVIKFKSIHMDTPLPEISATVSKSLEKTQTTVLVDNVNECQIKEESSAKQLQPDILKVLTGRCRFEKLPPLPKKIVRIFVSSTFTDTKEERNALMQHVYPKLSDYCRDKHGLEFQVVDMRWGVPEQASDNHTTSELCIQEIKKCQEVSVGPNFMALVGDKYGYRPIPRSVEESLFQSLKSAQITGWDLVEEWYKKDTNAVPAVYILQPISSKIQHYNNVENAELRTAAWGEWNRVNQQLSVTLRAAADRGYEGHTVSLMQKQLFYMSVTESEITTGVLEGRSNPSESCYCVIRKINDIENNVNEAKAPRFLDLTKERGIDTEAKSLLDELTDCKLKEKVPGSNLTMVDIEWSVSGACISLEKYQDGNVLKDAQSDANVGLLKHKEYIDSLCNDAFAKLHKLIQEGTNKQTDMYDDLTTEILQHFHLAKMRCDIFEGREDILSKVREYLCDKDASLLVVHGNSGCGKTSILAKVFESASNQLYKNHQHRSFTVVARFLGTSTQTSNVHQLLVSMCMQLSKIFRVPWIEPELFTELVKSFHSLLENATREKPVLLLLDSIDQLMPVYNAYKLRWLPEAFPPNVKLIASTIEEGYTILGVFKDRYSGAGFKTIEVNPLGEQTGLEVIKRWLDKDKRQITENQRSTVRKVLTECSLPLYARIVFDHVRKWRSFDIPTVEQLDTTIKGAINKLFQQMEDKFGKQPVQHCLGYLTASRYGLSDAELEHILSLDDLLLNKIFRLWNPPVRRIPALIWTRIRAEIHSYIVERSADDQLVLYWYHRQFILTTKARYLADSEFAKHINLTLVEYFSGKWGNGKEKPFTHTDSQMKRFGFDKPAGKADRKVPGQPYWTESQVNGKTTTRYNKRKLSELPYHLIRNKDYEQLKGVVFFSYEWLFAKMKSTNVQQMIEEVEIFMQADKLIKKDPEMKLLYANLQLIRPYIIAYPESLSYEISGRLAKYVGKYRHMTALIKQCDSIGRKICPLIPLSTCFETASLGFQQNLNFRSKQPLHESGSFTCSPDFRTLYILDYNDAELPIVTTWDVESGEKIHEVIIQKQKSEELTFMTDIYVQVECTKGGKSLLGFSKKRMDLSYQTTVKPGFYFIDVIDLESGKVRKTHEIFLNSDEYLNSLFYLTENHMCVGNGVKMPMINFTDDTVHSFHRPTVLSLDETFFIMCGKDKTTIRIFNDKKDVGEFEVQEHQMAVTASHDFSVVAMMGAETKNISVFDLSNRLRKLKAKWYQVFQSKVVFQLDDKTAESVADIFKPVSETLADGRIQEKTNHRVIMKISPDKRHLMVVFVAWKWMAFLWKTVGKYSEKYVGKYSAKFVGAITPEQMQCGNRYPMFNYDSSALVHTSMKRKVLIVSTENVEVTNEYEMKEDIKDICVSQVSNKVAVMLQKSIMLLNIVKEDGGEIKGKFKHAMTHLTEVLLPRETIKGVVHSEIVQKMVDDQVELEEVEDLAMTVNTDRIASARSKSHQALEKHYTPDGLRAIHVHMKAQVIDTAQQEIKYTPKPGETISRNVVGPDGVVINETLPIPDVSTRVNRVKTSADSVARSDIAIPFGGNLEQSGSGRKMLKDELLKPILTGGIASDVLSLRHGDRIVNDSNKIKFRVMSESEGQLQVMVVPSVITVYAIEDSKLQKLQRIIFYQESILTVSNAYLVTWKTGPTSNRGQTRNFVKIYDQGTGKSMAVHDMPSTCQCAKFSSGQEYLFVVDHSLTVKQLQGPQFTAALRTFSLMNQELPDAVVVKDVILFQSNRDAVLVTYGPAGPDVLLNSRYIFYDFISNRKSQEMHVVGGFEDISVDGKFGVDSRLSVYELGTGTVFVVMDKHSQTTDDNRRMSQHTDTVIPGEMMTRISLDNKYLVCMWKKESTLHLLHISESQLETVATCVAHATDILPGKGLSLRFNSNVILLNTRKRILAIHLAVDVNDDYCYDSEYARSQSIIRSSSRPESEEIRKVRVVSVFEQRKLLMHQVDVKQKEMTKTFSKSNKPSVLIISEPILNSNIFTSGVFSSNLQMEKKNVQNVDDALVKFRGNNQNYDAIILQLITEDVTIYDTPDCLEKMTELIEMARQKTGVVILSYAPCRSDSKKLNEKTMQINEKLGAIYGSSGRGGKGLHICTNSNLYEGGKPNAKYFKDGLYLSAAGLKKICENFKIILAPLLGMHHI